VKRSARDHCIGSGQDRLGRAVIARERHHRGRLRELAGEFENVAHRGGAERVDRLRIVADHGQPAPVGLELEQDRGLETVGVLVLVDQHMVEPAGDVFCDRRLAHHLRPVEQQIVVVELVLVLLDVEIGGKQRAQLVLPRAAPRVGSRQHRREFLLRIDGTGVDGEAGRLGGKPAFLGRETEIVADQVHQVGGILPVMDSESRVQSDLRGVFPQQPRADGMEGAGPAQRAGQRSPLDRSVRPERLIVDALDPPRHLDGGAARERHQQDAAGIDAVRSEMHHAMGKRAGLARSGARDHQERSVGRGIADPALANTVLDSAALVGVELVEIGRRHRRIALLEAKQDESCPIFVRNSGGRGIRRMGRAQRNPSRTFRQATPMMGFAIVRRLSDIKDLIVQTVRGAKLVAISHWRSGVGWAGMGYRGGRALGAVIRGSPSM
jgi:hypothetical protein